MSNANAAAVAFNMIIKCFLAVHLMSRCAAICTSGRYSGDGTGFNDCKACPHGKTSDNGATTCVCRLNTIKSGDTCSICPHGMYADLGDEKCSNCTCRPGNYIKYAPSTHGSSGLYLYPPSTHGSSFLYQESGCGSCTPCQLGYFTSNTSALACSQCPHSSLTNSGGTGATGCAECDSDSSAEAYWKWQSSRSRNSYGGDKYYHNGYEHNNQEKAYECSRCPSQHPYRALGAAFCNLCRSGFFAKKITVNSRLGFDPGYRDTSYTSIDGTHYLCQRCPNGKYTSVNGSTACIQCPAGSWASNGVDCIKCAAGKYLPYTYATTCTLCPVGRTSAEGATACTPCNQGETSSSPFTSCFPCPTGSYELYGVCKVCPIGKFTDTNGSTQCNFCIAGTYGSNGKCSKCGAGTYSIGNGGYCLNCPTGKYSKKGSTVCDDCPLGKYNDVTGKPFCQNCLAGRYNDYIGHTSCKNCGAGKYSELGAETCTNCPKGKYSREVSQKSKDSCLECPGGTYAVLPGSVDCVVCPLDMFSQPGSSACNSESGLSNVHQGTNGADHAFPSALILVISLLILVVCFLAWTVYRLWKKSNNERQYSHVEMQDVSTSRTTISPLVAEGKEEESLPVP